MTTSAIVIGAGITGVSAAEWLRRAGARVTLIDRIDPGAPEQASFGNAGLLACCAVVPVSEPGLLFKAPKMLLDADSPLFLRWRYLPRLLPWLWPFLRNARADRMEAISRTLASLTSDSVDQHYALASGTEAEKYIKTGDYTFYFRNRKAFVNDWQAMNLREKLGFRFTELDRAELLARDPALGERYGFGATFSDHGWLSSPGEYVAALGRHFTQNGGSFLRGEVTGINATTVTLASGKTATADRIILAAGAWSARLAGKLGQRAFLETERGYHLILRKPNHLPPNPFMVTDAKFVVTPMGEDLRCAGIVEFGGLNAPPSDAPALLLKKRIRQVYPTLRWESEEVWMGHRPSTPDSLPHLGPIEGAPGVIAAFGSQHVGITIGPRLGRMAADLALERKVNEDLAPFRPDRFA
ncbi:MAG: NAD(P)/FAD-dependent oxidoreductase [Paracoccaceae bacterium]